MIDPELVGELEALCRKPGMSVPAASTTEDLLGQVAVRFSLDRSRLWWWETMPDARFVPYGAEEELTVLGSLLSGNDQVLTLVVTDDEAPPWIAVEGRWTSLLLPRKLADGDATRLDGVHCGGERCPPTS